MQSDDAASCHEFLTVTLDCIQDVNDVSNLSKPEIVSRVYTATDVAWQLTRCCPSMNPLLVLSTFDEQADAEARSSNFCYMFSNDHHHAFEWWSSPSSGSDKRAGLVWSRRDGRSLAYVRGLRLDRPSSLWYGRFPAVKVSAVMFTPIPHACEPGRDRVRAAFQLARTNGHGALIFDAGILSCPEALTVISEELRVHSFRPARVFCPSALLQ